MATVAAISESLLSFIAEPPTMKCDVYLDPILYAACRLHCLPGTNTPSSRVERTEAVQGSSARRTGGGALERRYVPVSLRRKTRFPARRPAARCVSDRRCRPPQL